MALLNPTTPATTGTVVTGAAVSSSDTINGNYAGGYLIVINGSGSSINVTIVDPGRTALGNTGTNAAIAVANGASKAIKLTSAMVDSTTNLITVNFSATTTVTYVLYPPTTT